MSDQKNNLFLTLVFFASGREGGSGGKKRSWSREFGTEGNGSRHRNGSAANIPFPSSGKGLQASAPLVEGKEKELKREGKIQI